MPASVNNSGVPQIRSSSGWSGLHSFLPAPVWNLLAVLTRNNTCVWSDTQLPGDAVVHAWTTLCPGGLLVVGWAICIFRPQHHSGLLTAVPFVRALAKAEKYPLKLSLGILLYCGFRNQAHKH